MGTRIIGILGSIEDESQRGRFLASVSIPAEVAPFLERKMTEGEPPPSGHFYDPQTRQLSFIVANEKQASYSAVTEITAEEADNVIAVIGPLEIWGQHAFHVAVEGALGRRIPRILPDIWTTPAESIQAKEI